ncbi:ArsA family ATPase [Candidatus Roizmanbacteria bacterium]|nr:ArsA family ATPase [Candidatus Roizmanbacteria bacterium]
MKNQFFANPKLNFIIFGGKGGSGKTTSACAAALYLGQKYKNKKILIVSTDPAPSVGDSFNVEVGNKITEIKKRVFAQELDAKELMEDFRKKNLEIIKTLADRGTYLSREDIEEFASLSLPGMDEVMAVIKIADLLKTKKYDLIILDTAPTGHTKVLLSLPKKMKRWLKVADLMMEKHRFMMRRIRGKYVKDECDKFLQESLADIERVEELLKNSETTEFVPVTIPEPMSILETEGLVHDLKEMDILVKSIICNRVVVPSKCPFCHSRAKEKEKYKAKIEEKFRDYNLVKMPLFPTEIRGQDSLNEYAQILFSEKEFKTSLPKGILPKFPEIPEGKMVDFLKEDLNFIICGGKGGVGKTSISAATAIAFAKKYKDKKILVTTTDPAHALSNIFNQDVPLGEKVVSIQGIKNLDGLEIDAQKLLQDFKDEYKKDISQAFEKFLAGGVDIAFDRKVMEELMDLSPPGLEELMALAKITDLMKEGKYDIYVLDSAASGHLLRFLELPGLAREWLNSIFKILLKYRRIARLTVVAQKMIDFSKDVRKIQETLFGSKKTEFIMIGIAEEMGRREMGDLAESLEKLNVNFNYIIMNYIYPPSRCAFCQAKRKDQEKCINSIRKKYPSKKLLLVPLLPQDIRGIDSLNKLSKIIYGI